MQKKNSISYASYFDNVFQRSLVNAIELCSGRRKVQKIYNEFTQIDVNGETFWSEALDGLNVTVNFNSDMLEQVPTDKPLVVIANHPFGIIDGLAICMMVSRIRPDFKVVLNSVLCRDKRIEKHTLPIDFGHDRNAILTNINTKKACLAELKAGGTIIIFPAGGVSTAPSAFANAVDLDWKPFVAKLIQASQATVLPVYFHGQNSRLFQIVSQFSLTLRLGLYLYELNKMIGSQVDAIIGQPIPYEALAEIPKREILTEYLRDEIYQLSSRIEKPSYFGINS